MRAYRVAIAVAAGWMAVGSVRATSGGTVDVSTGAGTNWTVSGGGAVNATPDLTGSSLTLTSNGLASGTPVTGFNNAAFDGFWVADNSFTIPAGATNPSLSFSNLFADDRAVLFLNGTQIANFGGDGPGTGLMVLTDGSPNSSFTFINNTSGTSSTGFNIGGTNTLEAIVNNTTGGINANAAPLAGTNGTDFGLVGTVSFSPAAVPATAIPVPPALWMGLGTLVGIFGIARIRRRTVA
jgi:hypothetical protein